MEKMKRYKRGDLILILIGLAIALPLLLGFLLNNKPVSGKPSGQRRAVITRNGNTIAELSLNNVREPQYFSLDDGIHVTIVAENGTIRFLDADCPDKICVKTGTLINPGDQAICMPSKTIVKIIDS